MHRHDFTLALRTMQITNGRTLVLPDAFCTVELSASFLDNTNLFIFFLPRFDAWIKELSFEYRVSVQNSNGNLSKTGVWRELTLKSTEPGMGHKYVTRTEIEYYISILNTPNQEVQMTLHFRNARSELSQTEILMHIHRHIAPDQNNWIISWS